MLEMMVRSSFSMHGAVLSAKESLTYGRKQTGCLYVRHGMIQAHDHVASTSLSPLVQRPSPSPPLSTPFYVYTLWSLPYRPEPHLALPALVLLQPPNPPSVQPARQRAGPRSSFSPVPQRVCSLGWLSTIKVSQRKDPTERARMLNGARRFPSDSLDWSARPSFLPLLQLDAAPLQRAGPTKSKLTRLHIHTMRVFRLTPNISRPLDEHRVPDTSDTYVAPLDGRGSLARRPWRPDSLFPESQGV